MMASLSARTSFQINPFKTVFEFLASLHSMRCPSMDTRDRLHTYKRPCCASGGPGTYSS